MAGQNNNADAELNDFFESLDPLLEDFLLDLHQQVPAAQVDVQPDPAAPAHTLPGVPHQQMVVDLQPAMQLPHQQAPPMIHQQYPQPAQATPPQHQQMLGQSQSQATVPRHPRHHMISELMLIRPPQYQQAMMGESSQAVMAHQYQQMLVDPPAAYGGGEGQLFAAAPHDPDGDLGLHALRIEDEEENLPGGGGNAGSMNVASIPRLRNQQEMPEYAAAIIERMRNSGGRVKEVNNLLAASSSAIRAPQSPAHPPVNNDPSRAMETDVLPSIFSTTIRNLPPVAPRPAHRWASRREDEQEETRRYVSAAAAEAKEELKTHYPKLKKLSRKKEDLHLKYRRIVKINEMIQKCEKGSRRHVGSQLSKIRREVEKYLTEKRGLYFKFRDLVVKETGNCHDLPPCRNDDEAGPSGGSGAAGAAVAYIDS